MVALCWTTGTKMRSPNHGAAFQTPGGSEELFASAVVSETWRNLLATIKLAIQRGSLPIGFFDETGTARTRSAAFVANIWAVRCVGNWVFRIDLEDTGHITPEAHHTLCLQTQTKSSAIVFCTSGDVHWTIFVETSSVFSGGSANLSFDDENTQCSRNHERLMVFHWCSVNGDFAWADLDLQSEILTSPVLWFCICRQARKKDISTSNCWLFENGENFSKDPDRQNSTPPMHFWPMANKQLNVSLYVSHPRLQHSTSNNSWCASQIVSGLVGFCEKVPFTKQGNLNAKELNWVTQPSTELFGIIVKKKELHVCLQCAATKSSWLQLSGHASLRDRGV